MKVLLGLIAVGICIENIVAQGAGRAIPLQSENFVINLFRQYNRRIEYDTTNFLVDLAGNYANCNYANTRKLSEIALKTQEGATIGLIQDNTRGYETHTNAVAGYIEPVFESWVRDNENAVFRAQIANAERFGCSVRPGCSGGYVSVACLFSPAESAILDPSANPLGDQNAKAFTKQQYSTAEQMTKQKWDTSHFLENLSGYETDCSMAFERYHSFSKAKDIAKVYGKEVDGLFGYADNKGSTPVALAEILEKMKMNKKTKEVGCSLIPDCLPPDNGQMYVVVSCIFEL